MAVNIYNCSSESDDERDDAYLSENSETSVTRRNIHVIDYSSDTSDKSETSLVLRNVRKRARPISSSSEDSDSSEEWNWQEVENIPTIKRFNASSGINTIVLRRLATNPSPLSVLRQILCDDFFEMVAKETNRYATQVINGRNTKNNEEWFAVTSDELQAYFALCIIMSQTKKSNIDMYWSKRAILETPIFSKTMPRKRYLAISHFLHFVDNEAMNKEDKLRKVRSVVDYLNDKFQRLYTLDQNVVIDESLMKFKGRLNYVQFIATKRARFGIKFYKLCESESGYCSQFKIYIGQDKIPGNNTPASQNVVMELAKSILGKGYTLFLDNWYSSPELFYQLKKNDTNVVGTVRKNRKNMPKKLKSYKIKKGEVKTLSCRDILSLRWRDKKDIYMISTKHRNAEMIDTRKIRRMKNGGEENVIKPKCVLDYNCGMGGVDKQDQLLACFPIMRKCVKGYRKIFFYLIDMAVYNAFVLYSKLPNTPKQKIVNFRLDIAEDMLSNLSLPNYRTRGRPSQSDCPIRLQGKTWAHFPEHIPPTDKKQHPAKRCHVCFKHGIRSETTWQCKQCLIPLHLPGCFERYHSLQDY